MPNIYLMPRIENRAFCVLDKDFTNQATVPINSNHLAGSTVESTKHSFVSTEDKFTGSFCAHPTETGKQCLPTTDPIDWFRS